MLFDVLLSMYLHVYKIETLGHTYQVHFYKKKMIQIDHENCCKKQANF